MNNLYEGYKTPQPNLFLELWWGISLAVTAGLAVFTALRAPEILRWALWQEPLTSSTLWMGGALVLAVVLLATADKLKGNW